MIGVITPMSTCCSNNITVHDCCCLGESLSSCRLSPLTQLHFCTFIFVVLLLPFLYVMPTGSRLIRVNFWSQDPKAWRGQSIFIWNVRGIALPTAESRDNFLNKTVHLHAIFHPNRTIRGWDIKKNHFQNGGRPQSWIFEICYSGQVTCVTMWFCCLTPNFALIGRYGAEI